MNLACQAVVDPVSVAMLLDVAITGRLETSHAGWSLVQFGSGGVNNTPLESQPWKMIGFAGVGAFVNDAVVSPVVTVYVPGPIATSNELDPLNANPVMIDENAPVDSSAARFAQDVPSAAPAAVVEK